MSLRSGLMFSASALPKASAVEIIRLPSAELKLGTPWNRRWHALWQGAARS